MKKKELQKLFKKNKSNAGFTLTELLVGLFMSIFVIGALGFGLMQVLGTSQSEGSKTAARNETGRALDFISDELRRAQAIEVNMSDGHIFDNPNAVAPAYDLPTGGTVRLALQIPGVDQRVIYSVAPPQSGSPWKGPLVIYRWGPELTANGTYSQTGTKSISNPAGWTNEALIDKVNDTEQTEICGGTSTIFSGFFACVVDDDGDGQAITAQLYFTGETITVSGQNSSYSADTRAVARARTAPGNNSEDLESYTMSFRTLDPSFACNNNSDWTMRTDFGESLSDPGSIDQWDHKKNGQPQPIKISGDTLVISSVPRSPSNGETTCNNRRINNGRELTNPTNPRDFSGNIGLGENTNWVGTETVVAVSHFIDFKDPRTFNGDKQGTCDSNHVCTGSNGGKVNTKKIDDTIEVNSSVAMLKRGSLVPDYGGFDPEGDGTDANGDGIVDPGNQQSLGEFLASLNLAELDANGRYVITNELKPDERIIGFEIGHTEKLVSDNPNPGFDLQDNIFIVKSEAFSKEYDYTPLL
jgi:type II secretory pathway pseudopilin PulG